MNIKWYGLSTFLIKHKDVKVVIDPHKVDLKLDTIEPNIIVTSKDVKIKKGDYHIFNWPGEYEAKNVAVNVIPYGKKSIIVFDIDDIKFCHLTSIHKELPDEIVNKIGNVDVLFVALTTAQKTSGHKEAVDLIEELEPKCVIPMNYRTESFGDDLVGNEDFLKEVGIKEVEELDNLSLKGFSADKTEYFVLKASKV